ncbi:H-NS histone family protein [Burkholderia pyrrocinia]|uniref:H-NS histone family protein n=1 Tax=Burkholderia pyrrocinia TaxID=60550 RepID=UPI00215A1D4F|nr:H-NS histone family protein [Burkholderia pyrrocinia]UVE69939.1 H-NS histone family protein [Burkholderia pyrrocinia]
MDQHLSEKLLEIRSEIDALNRKAKAAAIAQVVQLMTQYGIVPSDLKAIEYESPLRKAKVKYWNPQTGQTWSGRGRIPRWLVGKDLEAYRIVDRSGQGTEDPGGGAQQAESSGAGRFGPGSAI